MSTGSVKRVGFGHQRRAFSLLELVLNIVILSMLAAIAVPRFSSAAQAAEAKSMAMTLTRVRNAIEHYYAEHSRYPGYNAGTGAPNGEWFVDQLTKYSDASGNVNATLVYPFIYGPYLRAPFPTNPLNDLNTVLVRAAKSGLFTPNVTGWKAVLSTGHFTANNTRAEIDGLGIADGDFDSMEGMVVPSF
ncbi:MAG: prepilin-type N-terminal cleavage/methylation domain-containing protein [bacterium]|nr:prepilin-type N-terminal cleavage/methylation domain-containing protein [bacterium]